MADAFSHFSLYFNSRSPRGDRLQFFVFFQRLFHFNSRSPRGDRLFFATTKLIRDLISIHGLLAETDMTQFFLRCVKNISIHGLLAETDQVTEEGGSVYVPFQFTVSSRRPTSSSAVCGAAFAFQFTVSLRRPTATIGSDGTLRIISIHGLLAETDWQ